MSVVRKPMDTPSRVTLHLPADTPVIGLVEALAGLGLMIDAHDSRTGVFTAVRIDRSAPRPLQPSVCPTVARIRAARAGVLAT